MCCLCCDNIDTVKLDGHLSPLRPQGCHDVNSIVIIDIRGCRYECSQCPQCWLFWPHTETKMSSFWRNFHHWLHWKLSFWQLPVQPVMNISSKWRLFRFSAVRHLVFSDDLFSIRCCEISWQWPSSKCLTSNIKIMHESNEFLSNIEWHELHICRFPVAGPQIEIGCVILFITFGKHLRREYYYSPRRTSATVDFLKLIPRINLNCFSEKFHLQILDELGSFHSHTNKRTCHVYICITSYLNWATILFPQTPTFDC